MAAATQATKFSPPEPDAAAEDATSATTDTAEIDAQVDVVIVPPKHAAQPGHCVHGHDNQSHVPSPADQAGLLPAQGDLPNSLQHYVSDMLCPDSEYLARQNRRNQNLEEFMEELENKLDASLSKWKMPTREDLKL